MISVVIPLYNKEKSIASTLQSVYEQTYTDYEVVIVNDGSTDNSANVVKDFIAKIDDRCIDDRWTLICQENAGVSAARNRGIIEAKGEYVAFLDADDFWREDKLEKQLKVMEKYSYRGVRPVICTTGRSLVSESGRYLGRFIGCDKIITYEKLLMGNQINCSSVLMKKSIAERFCFPEGDFHEDYALWLDILSHGSFAVGINLPLLRYRVRRDSQSGHKLKSALMTYRVYRYSGLGIFESMYYMVHYALKKIKKYFF